MKSFLLLISLFLLHSCQTNKHIAEQCMVDLLNKQCHCRSYEFSLERVGPLAGNFSAKSYMYCQRLVGFPDYADTASFWESVRKEILRATNDPEA